jgi:phage-related protein
LGSRDPKDVPFVALYIDLGARNIISYDKDFNHPLLQPLRIDKAGQIVAGVYRGLPSFFILNDITPAALEFLGQLILCVIRTLLNAVKLLIDFFSAISQKAIDDAINLLSNFFPEIKNWIESGAMNIALFIIALIVRGTVMVDRKARNNLQKLTSLVVKSLQPSIDKFVGWIDRSMGPLIDSEKILLPHTLAILVTLFANISTVISEVKFLPSQVA